MGWSRLLATLQIIFGLICAGTELQSYRVLDSLFSTTVRNRQWPMASNLELRPETKEFLFTLFKYVECHKLLDEKYQQVDKGGILAKQTIGTDSKGIVVPPKEEGTRNSYPRIYKQEYQQQAVSGNIVESLDDLYAAAEVAKPVFVETIHRLVKPLEESCDCTISFDDHKPDEEEEISTSPPPLPSEVIGGKRQRETTNEEETIETDLIKVTIAPFKGRERATEKAEDDYSHRTPGPGISWLFDIVRASIEFGSVEQILKFLQVLESDPSIHMVQAKNRFQVPTLTGYRDLNLHIQIQAPINGEERMIHSVCELQIHLRNIKELQSKLESHKYYEYFRSFFAGATGTLKSRFEDLQRIGNGKALDEEMLSHYLKTNMDEERIILLGRLFEDQFVELEWALRIQRRLLAIRKIKYDLSIKVAVFKNMSDPAKNEMERKARSLSSTYRDMGRILVKQGDIDGALDLYNQSRKESYKMKNDINNNGTCCQENDLLVAEAHNIIGILETKRKKFRRAMKMHEFALKIYMETNGKYHPSVAVTYGNMGNVLMQMEKWDDATEYYNKCLDIFQVNLGEDHFCVWNVLNNIGILFSEQGKYKEALVKFEESLSSSEMSLGVAEQLQSNQFHANLYNNMGVTLERLYSSEETNGNKEWIDQAVGKYQLALETYQKALGDDHFAMIGTYNNITNALAKQGNLDKAIEMLDKSIAIQSRVLGKDHLDLVKLYEAKIKLREMQNSPQHELVEISDEMERIRLADERPARKKHPYHQFGYVHAQQQHRLPGAYRPMWNKHRTWHTAEWKDQMEQSKWSSHWPRFDSSSRFQPGGGIHSYFAGSFSTEASLEWNDIQRRRFPNWKS